MVRLRVYQCLALVVFDATAAQRCRVVLTSSRWHLPITVASIRAVSGAARRSMSTSTSLTSVRCSFSSTNRSEKSGKRSCETALGITSQSPQEACTQQVLTINRGHWTIENTHYISDWNYDEDRNHIRTGHGPENITRLHRFAVGILKSFQTSTHSIAEKMRKLRFCTRRVFDYLRMTRNSASATWVI